MTYISNDFEEINWAVQERRGMKTQYQIVYTATRDSLGPIKPSKVELCFGEPEFDAMCKHYRTLSGMEDVKDLKISKRKVIYTEWEEIEL